MWGFERYTDWPLQILVELWRINQGQVTYTAPGGPVWSGAAPNPNRSGP